MSKKNAPATRSGAAREKSQRRPGGRLQPCRKSQACVLELARARSPSRALRLGPGEHRRGGGGGGGAARRLRRGSFVYRICAFLRLRRRLRRRRRGNSVPTEAAAKRRLSFHLPPIESELGSIPVFPWQRLDEQLAKGALGMIVGQRQMAWELTAAQKRNSFGSCQEKKIFPFSHAPDRLGNEHVPIKGDPSRGPGAYNHAERNTLLYHLVNRPESTKGYTMGARTAPRFGHISKSVAPDPTVYQAIWIKEHKHRPVFAPFSSRSPRFSEHIRGKERMPGPGTYNPNKMPHRHVTRPGKFGSPDWALVPMPEKRTFKAELLTDKEFKKHRNLVAYLSLYYSD